MTEPRYVIATDTDLLDTTWLVVPVSEAVGRFTSHKEAQELKNKLEAGE